MSALATHLFREVRPDFFRLLAGPLARLYVDALHALEYEAAQRNQGLERDEALALVEQVVEDYGDLKPEETDPLAQASTIRDKARVILDTLRKTGWVQEEECTDWQKLIFFDPNGTLLLHALRKIAYPEAAVFSDKLISVCFTLSNRNALADQPWGQIETCIASLEAGLTELRSMQRSIERHTKHQLASSTLKENLEVIFDQFSERIGRACYTQLVHARLPTRLAEAQYAMDELANDVDLLGKMQTEVMRRDSTLTPESAMSRVRLRLNELEELLGHIEPLAMVIDRRTAEFARRSQARFRYLQETTSENRARVQDFFETLNQHFAGYRVGELDNLGIEFPTLRLHDTRIIGGMESLYTPRLRRAAGEIEPLEDSDTRQQDRALAQLENTMRDSLTVSRANHFISSLPLEKGSSIDSAELLREHVHNDEDIASIIACLLHARSADCQYEIKVPRREGDLDAGEFDTKLLYRIERFTLLKK